MSLLAAIGPDKQSNRPQVRRGIVSKIIGIDLGTTNSVVSVMEGGEAKVSPPIFFYFFCIINLP